MNKHLAKPIIAAALLGFTQFASAIEITPCQTTQTTQMNLQGLIDNSGYMRVGDKCFADFGKLDDGTPSTVNYANILVDVVGDGSAGNEWGLSFTTVSNDLKAGPAVEGFLYLYFGYSVEVMDPNNLISGITMSGATDWTDSFISQQGEHWLFGEKVVKEYQSMSSLGTMVIEDFTTIDSSNPFYPSYLDLQDQLSVSSSKLWIEDYFEVSVLYGDAEWTSWEQRFLQQPKQQVPVPATLALFGLGLLSLGFSRRKA